MKNVKTIIFYCTIFIFIVILVFGFFKNRNDSESLKRAFMDLQSARDCITAIEQQFDKAGKITEELREELIKERKNYNKLEQYSKELEAEYIKQRKIYREFRITNRSNQESVGTISKLVGQSRVILEGLLKEIHN